KLNQFRRLPKMVGRSLPRVLAGGNGSAEDGLHALPAEVAHRLHHLPGAPPLRPVVRHVHDAVERRPTRAKLSPIPHLRPPRGVPCVTPSTARNGPHLGPVRRVVEKPPPGVPTHPTGV